MSLKYYNPLLQNLGNKIGKTILDLREHKGLSRKEVAEHLNLAYSTIAHYESGITIPPTEVILSLAEFYGVSSDYIIGRSVSRVDCTKALNLKLNKCLTIGEAIEIICSLSKQDKEVLAYLIELMNRK